MTKERAMAMGGRHVAAVAIAAGLAAVAPAASAEDPIQSAGAMPVGRVVMPHPYACACSNEDKGWCAEFWEKHRPKHRERYLTQQHTRFLNHPECPPWCMENFGYYQTCWRRFPEQTLGCRYCWDGGAPPLPAAPVPAPPLPAQIAPHAPPSLPPTDLKPLPPAEYETLPEPVPAPEREEIVPKIVPTSTFINDPAWRAGLRSY